MSDATFRIWDEQDLMALMSLEEVAPSRFRSVLGQRNENGRTYGGQLMAQALIYVSDWWINFVSCLPHFRPAERAGKGLYSASLNHAIWLHRPARADDWLYFETESPSAGGGRGLAIARIFDPEGAMVATATQESLITRREI